MINGGKQLVLNITITQCKQFSLLVSLVLAVLFFWIFFNYHYIDYLIVSIFTFFLCTSFFAPQVCRPLCWVWLRFGLLLSKITLPIIIVFLFYFMITPMGFLIRIFSKNYLNLNKDEKIQSYWQTKNKDLSNMNNQF